MVFPIVKGYVKQKTNQDEETILSMKINTHLYLHLVKISLFSRDWQLLYPQ